MRTVGRLRLQAGVVLMTAGIAAMIAAGCGGESPTATLAPATQPTTAPAPTATTAPTKAAATVAAAIATVAPTQTPTAAPTTVTATQSGTLRVAVGSISPPVFLPSKLKWPTNLDKIAWGVADPITYHGIAAPKLGDVVPKALGESWTVAPDGTSVTFKIRKGVQFHEGWGELTAKDVVYTFDEAFKEGTLAKIAEEGLWMSKWVLVDDYTVTMTAKQGQKVPPLWARIVSNNSQLGGIWSKAVFDKLGADKASETPIGTGPFKVKKWVANDQVILEAVERHYRETPKIKGVTIREIPEEATRLAAFKAGELDISPVSLRFLKKTLDETGARAQQTNPPTRVVVWFGGNYWEKRDPVAGTDVPRRDGFKPDDAHPWIGDPDNPDRNERARKVRRAMAYAINREALNKAILNGLGQVGPETWYNFAPSDTGYKKEWAEQFEFNLDKGKALLKEANYPNGFEAEFFVAPDLPAIVDPQVGQAIAQMWQDGLGIKVRIDSTAYAAKRPTLVDRSFSGMYIWTYGSPSTDEPQIYNQYPIKGWNPGVEIPCATQVWYEIRAELDGAVRLKRNVEAQDCLDKWAWNTVILTQTINAVVAKNVDWSPSTLPGVDAGDFEKAVIKK